MLKILLQVAGATIGLTLGLASVVAYTPLQFVLAWAYYGDNVGSSNWYLPFLVFNIILVGALTWGGIKAGGGLARKWTIQGKDIPSVRIALILALLIYYFIILPGAAFLFFKHMQALDAQRKQEHKIEQGQQQSGCDLLKSLPVVARHTEELSADKKVVGLAVQLGGSRAGDYAVELAVTDYNRQIIYTTSKVVQAQGFPLPLRYDIDFAPVSEGLKQHAPGAQKMCVPVDMVFTIRPSFTEGEKALLAKNMPCGDMEAFDVRKQESVYRWPAPASMCNFGDVFHER